LAVTAEIRLTANRSPVVATTGVRPIGAQVVPAWSSERTPASSAK
jgi:hypothetical protein